MKLKTKIAIASSMLFLGACNSPLIRIYIRSGDKVQFSLRGEQHCAPTYFQKDEPDEIRIYCDDSDPNMISTITCDHHSDAINCSITEGYYVDSGKK